MSVMQWQQLLQARTGQVPPASAALFLGNLDWACEEEWLREENITVIWNCVERHSGFQYNVIPQRRELLRQVLPGIQWCDWSPHRSISGTKWRTLCSACPSDCWRGSGSCSWTRPSV